jgi:hypothetical protein
MLIRLLKKLKLARQVTLVKPDVNDPRGGTLVRT